ncbi:MAG: cation transporter [Bacilli bacterium]|nr:cation transporter [Bacilli bacterium]
MNREKRIIRVSIYGIIVNFILVIFKAIIGFITGSIAVILDAINNLSDAASSIITIIGTKLSNKRPDKKHPYGYGRVEYFSSIIIAVIVLTAGLTSFKESFLKILKPELADYSVISIFIIIVAVLVKFFFGRFVKHEGTKLNSNSLIASGTDAISDSVLSLSTVIGAVISMIWHISLEGYLGIIISIVILKSAYEILKDTVSDMIGIRADSNLTKKLRKKVMSYKEVIGVYDLVLHNYGHNTIIGTAHIEVSDNMTAREIHKLTKEIAADIYLSFGINITLGIYASNSEGEFGDIKAYLNSLVKKYKTIIQVHGFYVDETNSFISFDLIFDFSEKNQEEIKNDLIKSLKSKYPEYNYYVVLDTDFSD